MWWISAGKKRCSWWCAISGERYEWRALNRLLVVQTGVSASQAKVFKAQAAPQGLCEHLINALKLLANQQEDGDGNWWCAACGGQYEWRAPNRILVVQLGVNANEAKVFTAYAAPLGLCDNLINAVKLLAKPAERWR